jgi:hypothetical protein
MLRRGAWRSTASTTETLQEDRDGRVSEHPSQQQRQMQRARARDACTDGEGHDQHRPSTMLAWHRRHQLRPIEPSPHRGRASTSNPSPSGEGGGNHFDPKSAQQAI